MTCRSLCYYAFFFLNNSDHLKFRISGCGVHFKNYAELNLQFYLINLDLILGYLEVLQSDT